MIVDESPQDNTSAAIAQPIATEALQRQGDANPTEGRWAERLAIKGGNKIIFVRSSNVVWIEAAGNYARLHTDLGVHLMRTTMAKLIRRLDPGRFVRIHRSIIVNLDFVREIQPMFHGEYVVILRDKTRLSVSRSYRSAIVDLWS